MGRSFRTGLGFGLTSGIITTLGLIVGLNAGTSSVKVIIAGILTIAIADSFSDALGIHVSKEAEGNNGERSIWKSTFYTWFFKLIVSLSFLIPIFILELKGALILMVVWGFFLLISFSYVVAKWNEEKPLGVIGEHVLVAMVVLVLAHYGGHLVGFLVV